MSDPGEEEQAAITSSPLPPCRPELDILAAELSRIAQENALPVATSEAPTILIPTVFALAEQHTRIHMETGDLSPSELQALDSLNEDLGLDSHFLKKNGRLEHPFRVGRDLGRMVRAALTSTPTAVAAGTSPVGADNADLFLGLMEEFGVSTPSSQCRAMILQEAATKDVLFLARLDEILDEAGRASENSLTRAVTVAAVGLAGAKIALELGGLLGPLGAELIRQVFKANRRPKDWQIWANNGSNPPEKVAKGLHPGSYRR